MNVPTYGELELTLGVGSGQGFVCDLRFRRPGDSELQVLCVDRPLSIDWEGLAEQSTTVEYGRFLTDLLFADNILRDNWLQATASTQATDQRLRVRLRINPSPATERLHGIKWETLYDPKKQTRLGTSERILFSRSLPTDNLVPLRLLPSKMPRVVAALCDPTDHEEFGLPAIETERHSKLLSKALSGFSVEVLRRRSDQDGVSVSRMMARLREGAGILYLVCHGRLAKTSGSPTPTPTLYFEDEQGQTKPVRGPTLVEQIKELQQPPLLVVLASCHSAGNESNLVLNSMAPLLAAAGVGAVIGLQGEASIDLIEKLLLDFFAELLRDGCVDRAMAVARTRRADGEDWWRPVLYLRLSSGLLWAPSETGIPATDRVAPAASPAPERPTAITSFDVLLSYPPVKEELREFKVYFQENYKTVVLLDWYKELHDRLQRAEEFYKIINGGMPLNQDRQFVANFFDDRQDALDSMNDKLSHVIEHLQTDSQKQSDGVVSELVDAARLLQEAKQGLDVDKLDRYMRKVGRLLGKTISPSNTRLQDQVRDLKLQQLPEPLRRVLTLAPELGATIEVQSELRDVIARLSERHLGLSAMSTEHDRWQQADNVLRRIAELLRAERVETTQFQEDMEEYWNELGRPMRPIIAHISDPKDRSEIETRFGELSKSVGSGKWLDFRRDFRTFYTLCGKRFVKVDESLKALCKGLSGDFHFIAGKLKLKPIE